MIYSVSVWMVGEIVGVWWLVQIYSSNMHKWVWDDSMLFKYYTQNIQLTWYTGVSVEMTVILNSF